VPGELAFGRPAQQLHDVVASYGAAVEPAFEFLGRNRHGHTVMQRGEVVAGRRGDDGDTVVSSRSAPSGFRERGKSRHGWPSRRWMKNGRLRPLASCIRTLASTAARTTPTTSCSCCAPTEGEFAWHEISTRVNRVVNDDAHCLLPSPTRSGGRGAEAAKAAPRKATVPGGWTGRFVV